MVKYTECKTKIMAHKRRLVYVNSRRRTTYPIKVGKFGGLSIKSPKAKGRRYIRGTCKKTKCSKDFWKTAKQIHKRKSQKRKK